MLEPFQRRHLIDALRPPPGSTLDQAIGTTYSLDLLALLTAPLAFTFFDHEADGDGAAPTADPIALLEALRRYADRITIFCDAGRIVIPRAAQLLYSYLEDSVFEAGAPAGGIFHPKLWLLRFVHADHTVSYRLLCLSRNLTFDRSWDTVLVLEGAFQPESEQHPRNEPLAGLIAALPALVVGRPLPIERRAGIQAMVDELPRVAFELPAGFDSLRFHPLGFPERHHIPFAQQVDRMLVISPFVTTNALRLLAGSSGASILISRLEELQEQPREILEHYAAVYTLSEAADLEVAAEQAQIDTTAALAGLHAKVYVGDQGDRAHVWTGSANATDAALHQNVELLVQLTGPRASCGIAAVLGADRDTGLFALLERFDPALAGVQIDTDQQSLDDLVEAWLRMIARLGLSAHVLPTAVPEMFDIELHLPEAGYRTLPAELTITGWPITRAAGSGAVLRLDTAIAARFSHVSYEGLTSFYAFEVSARSGARVNQARFVLNLPLVNAPPDRRQRLLRSLLRNRAEVLRFLLLLLSDSGSELEGIVRLTQQRAQVGGAYGDGEPLGLPLFEAMVCALDRDPACLDHIARLVDDLRAAPETRALLPDDFDAIWEPISAVARRVRR